MYKNYDMALMVLTFDKPSMRRFTLLRIVPDYPEIATTAELMQRVNGLDPKAYKTSRMIQRDLEMMKGITVCGKTLTSFPDDVRGELQLSWGWK